jgi:hypothetical protein
MKAAGTGKGKKSEGKGDPIGTRRGLKLVLKTTTELLRTAPFGRIVLIWPGVGLIKFQEFGVVLWSVVQIRSTYIQSSAGADSVHAKISGA